MNEMIERVARAIMPDAWHETVRADGSKYFTLVCWDEEQAKARRYARAAIWAMREPTLEMRKACSFETAEVEYPAMVDAALRA